MRNRYRAVTRLKFCVRMSLLKSSGKRDALTHPKREATDVARRFCTAIQAVLFLLAPSEARRC
jgi:hypothetical protein